jgi:hypothetical protein
MSTTPPEEQPPTTADRTAGARDYGTTGTTGTAGTTRSMGSMGAPWFGSMPGEARLPIPGNAEFALYVVALLLAALVCLVADRLDSGAWFDFFKWTTIAYLLSRGIAKASRVLEQ